MRTLIVYDANGYVFYTASGDVKEPVGVPFMWVDVTPGKYVSNVDVTSDPHEAELVDLPKSEVDKLNDRLTVLQSALDDVILHGGVV